MLAKSRKSAVIMGSIVVLTTILVDAIAGMVRYFLYEGQIAVGEVVGSEAIIGITIVMLCLLFVVGISIALASVFIYFLDDSHFGRSGAVRWATMGVIYALLWQISSLLLPYFDGLVLKILEGLLRVLLIGLSYWLAFKLLSTDFTQDKGNIP